MNYSFGRASKTAMERRRRAARAAIIVLTLIACRTATAAIAYTPFGPNGEGGTVNGQVLSFGSGGEVFELDAFLAVEGSDLNGPTLGTAAQLSNNVLPAGLAFSFSSALSNSDSDLTLTYIFTNNTLNTLPSVWFGFFVDAEIDVAINDYFNEAAGQLGAAGTGAGDPAPDQWEVDEPGYVFGDVYAHLLSGVLDNSNAVPAGSPDDVGLALGFQLGSLAPGQESTVSMLLSDAGRILGDFALQHFDTDENSFDTLTVSGSATIVPEPSGSLLAAAGLVAFLLLLRSHPALSENRATLGGQCHEAFGQLDDFSR